MREVLDNFSVKNLHCAASLESTFNESDKAARFMDTLVI
jgi:hypothetical protein